MRIDLYLVKNSLCNSRTRAKQLIGLGAVTVDGIAVTKPSFEVCDTSHVEVSQVEELGYVGRGALKLQHALQYFGVNPENKICADIGASTGGFTQCLLNHGAKRVYAIDSGTNQLAQILKNDERVICMEKTNARFLTSDSLGENAAELTVMDVSFISQTLIYPAIINISRVPCDIITLIKPQFETNSKSALGKNGVIKDEKIRKAAVNSVADCAKQYGFKIMGICDSPILGGSGNTEYLMYMRLE